MTLEELRVIIKAETKEFREEVKKIKTTMQSTTSNVKSETNKIKSYFKDFKLFLSTLGIGATILAIGKKTISTAKSVESSIQQITRTMGKYSSSFQKWVNKNALSFNMAKADALSYGATYSNLLKSFLGTSEEVTSGTTDLLKASSIIASATGRTMSDVMERIRSGLLGNTEAIEDLGINVNVAMLQSTEAFKKFSGNKSWNQLDFQTQQQIRLFAILEQTTNKFGTNVLSNTNSNLQRFVAVLKDIAVNIGNAFLPIVNFVLPIFTALATKIKEVTSYMANFMSLLYGKKTLSSSVKNTDSVLSSAASNAGNLSSNLNDASASAVKTAKALGGLATFDDLNILSANASNGASGNSGTTGTALGGLEWDDSIFGEEKDTSGIEKTVNKVKKHINNMKKFIVKNKEPIIAASAGLFAGIAAFEIGKNWNTFAMLLTPIATTFQFLGLCASSFFAELLAGNGIMAALGSVFGASVTPILAVSSVVAAVTSALIYLYQTSESFENLVQNTIGSIKNILSKVFDNLLKPIFSFLTDAFKTVIIPIATFLATIVVDTIEVVASVILSMWNNLLAPVANFLVDVLAIALQGVIDVWESWKPTIDFIFSELNKIWNEMLAPLAEFIGNNLCDTFEKWGETVGVVIGGLKTVFQGIVDFITGVFSGDWEKAWNGIVSIFSTIFSGIAGVVKSPINGVISIVNGAIDKINGFGFDVPNWVPGIGGQSFKVNVPKLKYLARGGVINGLTPAVLGEYGKEVVMPLERNTGWIKTLANKINQEKETPYYSNVGGTYVIYLTLDGEVVTKKVIKNIKDYEKLTGEPVY